MTIRPVLFLILLFQIKGFSQSREAILVSPKPFYPGEVLNYIAYYHLGPIWIAGGEVLFRTDTTFHDGFDAYYFYSIGRNFPRYDWLFKVRDEYKSMVDQKSLRPFWYYGNIHEGKKKLINKYEFEYERKMVLTTSQKDDEMPSKDSIAFDGFVLDLLTATYFVRSIDFTKYMEGKIVRMNILIDDRPSEIIIQYLGIETIKTRGRKKYDCIKLTALLNEGTIFRDGEEIIIWLTNDQRRIPVHVKAKILVGSVIAVWQIQENEN